MWRASGQDPLKIILKHDNLATKITFCFHFIVLLIGRYLIKKKMSFFRLKFSKDFTTYPIYNIHFIKSL